jgi:hypothetical protein
VPFACYSFFFTLSICLTLIVFKGVNLLLKNQNISQANLVRLPSHLVTSEICQCPRSFHIFCTDSFPLNDQDIEMIYIHPAPRKYERGSSRRISTPYKQYNHPRHQENNQQHMIITARSAPTMNIPESQLLEKKVLIISVIEIYMQYLPDLFINTYHFSYVLLQNFHHEQHRSVSQPRINVLFKLP